VPTTLLSLAPLPGEVTGFFHDLSVRVAGLILLLGAFCRGWAISLWLIPCAVLACAGPMLGVPAVGQLTAAVEHGRGIRGGRGRLRGDAVFAIDAGRDQPDELLLVRISDLFHVRFLSNPQSFPTALPAAGANAN
jgi:hypothetical protein